MLTHAKAASAAAGSAGLRGSQVRKGLHDVHFPWFRPSEIPAYLVLQLLEGKGIDTSGLGCGEIDQILGRQLHSPMDEDFLLLPEPGVPLVSHLEAIQQHFRVDLPQGMPNAAHQQVLIPVAHVPGYIAQKGRHAPLQVVPHPTHVPVGGRENRGTRLAGVVQLHAPTAHVVERCLGRLQEVDDHDLLHLALGHASFMDLLPGPIPRPFVRPYGSA